VFAEELEMWLGHIEKKGRYRSATSAASVASR
jgi:hypothetical protein